MKILYLITSWDFGGAEMQVLQLVEKMQALNHNVLVVSIIKPELEFIKKSDKKNIEVQSLEIKKGVPDIRALIRLRRIIKTFKPDVLHAHMIHAVILARTTRLIASVPKLISTAHSINEGGGIRNLMYRFTDFLSDVNTNVSGIGTDLYIQKKMFKKHKTYFVPNGINLPAISGMTNNKTKLKKSLGIDGHLFVWLAVGRLEEAKDYFNLLEAVNELKKNQTDFIVLIAGSGSLKEAITNKITSLGLQQYVRLLGRRSDIPDLLQMADAFVMSSAWEGLPIAILEAASYGLPAVVTDVGGCKEIVEDKKNGFVVPSKSPLKLSEALRVMMQLSNDDMKAMSSYSIEKIRKDYTLDSVVAKWLKLYNGEEK